MLNALIALEEAGAANAAAAADGAASGGGRLSLGETLSATRESGRIILMARVEQLCRMSDTLCSPVSAAPPLSSLLPPPLTHSPSHSLLHSRATTASYLSLGLWSSITVSALSLAPCLENKLIFTPTPLEDTVGWRVLCPSIAVFV